MTKILIVLVVVYQIFSCQNQSSNSIEKNTANDLEIANVFTNVIYLDSLWNELVFVKGGCMTGGQYVVDSNFGGEGCVMVDRFHNRNNGWEIFFKVPKTELSRFLLKQISDTTTTIIHTCPCFIAIGGEVAVYALQNIYKKNWFDLKGFTKFSLKEETDCTNNEQSWLQEILRDSLKQKELKESWKSEIDM